MRTKKRYVYAPIHELADSYRPKVRPTVDDTPTVLPPATIDTSRDFGTWNIQRAYSSDYLPGQFTGRRQFESVPQERYRILKKERTKK